MKKQMMWKTKGMNQDLSVSAFNPEFSFENMNLRLSTNEGNTLMSWVNERGTKLIQFSRIDNWDGEDITDKGICGDPVGTAVLNHKLVIFTHHSSGTDYIYMFEYSDSAKTLLKGKLLYSGSMGLQTNHPLETLASYEAEHIQKVYWTDGCNQPRMINIVASYDKLKKWNTLSDAVPFDFVPVFKMGEQVEITNHVGGGGLFAPGVIQYAFTYINKYGQQSNLVYVSPLYHLAHSNRGATPEEKVANSFEIRITDIDQHFDYVRLYSIQRTNLDAVPFVKHLDDLPIRDNTFSRTLVYSGEHLTLPKDNNGWIKTAAVTNGSYSVSVTPYTPAAAFDSIEDIWIVGNDNGDPGEDIISLQNLINALQGPDNFSDGEPDIYFNNDYHSGFEVTQGLDMKLIKMARVFADNYTWGVKVGDSVFLTGDSTRGFYEMKFIYNYADQKWYITKDDVTETVTQTSASILYTDNGTTGATVDPTELLYVGGKEIKALTMTEKDQTLFMGNIEQKNSLVTEIQDYFDNLRGGSNAVVIDYKNDGVEKNLTFDHVNGIYGFTNSLKWDRSMMTTFKGGETYRFGFQLQKNTGEWTEPIFIDDKENDKYPSTHVYKDEINLVYAEADLPTQPFDMSLYKRIRPCIVYPTIGDRTVLCQGVLNPTVFNVQDRVDNSPFAQASWFFRPFMSGGSSDDGYSISIDKYVQVTVTTPLPNPIDLSIDRYFSDGQYLKQVGILIADVENNLEDQSNPLITGKVTYWYVDEYQGDPDSRTDHFYSGYDAYTVLGIIKLGAGDKYNTWYDASSGIQNTVDSIRYAFIFKTEPVNEHVTSASHEDGSSERSEMVYTNVHYKAVGNRTFGIFQDLKGQGHFLYYAKPQDDAPDHYHFKFWAEDGNTGYEAYVDVDFQSPSDESDYFPEHGDVQGDALRYKHYDYIFAQSEVTTTTGSNDSYYSQARQVEIQGSKNIYKKGNLDTVSAVFNLAKNTTNCNSQFFIDQSIVTLNSPDLEFDTEVQNYNAEDLVLRIVGAVPITANTSAHSIEAGAMEVENFGDSRPGTRTGSGELNTNVVHYNISPNGGKRLISDLLWNDVIAVNSDNEHGFNTSNPKNIYIYPWHKSGSITNDPRKEGAGSVLIKKKMSQLLYSINTEYLPSTSMQKFEKIGYQTLLTENAEIINARLGKQKKTSNEINYYPNIDKAIVNEDGYEILGSTTSHPFNVACKPTSVVSMKYKSTTHAVIALNAPDLITDSVAIPLLPYVIESGGNYGQYINPTSSAFPDTFWGSSYMRFSQSGINVQDLFMNGNSHVGHNLLWLGEIYKTSVSNRFGGTSKEAVLNNKWLIAGKPVVLDSSAPTVKVKWTYGDTYFQRYDALKTYAYTPEDQNQNIEILSFMCETHVNIDGRYDRNRGQIDNLNMSPVNFNLINPAYTQQDNIFTSRRLDYEDIETLKYPNQLIWSKTKSSGADIDVWTNITLANSLEMDGDKGEVKSLNRLNDQIICFQDFGIAQVLYNENTQISTTEGVPIEIANNGKVQGKRYLSNTVGCSNKWSIVNTSSGIYFIDSNEKAIYLFNGHLQNLSVNGGFNTWCKKNIPSGNVGWDSVLFDNFRGIYDKLNQEVMFINKNTALAWSEKIGAFTSFYDYSKAPYFMNLDDTGVWIARDPHNTWHPWKHQAGGYDGMFFGHERGYWMTLVGNPDPLTDKIFTNLEFRATTGGEGFIDSEGKYHAYLPFSQLEVWNEHQHGYTELTEKSSHDAMQHHTKDMTSVLKRKFRIWRCDIPRNNCHLDNERSENDSYSTDAELGISRYYRKPMDRIRNPWLYLKLKQDALNVNGKVEIHDMVMTYFD